uniref:Calcineurin-like phosphoesterase domain-containing protein n=1 Tax=Setaria digitata TaxID=48799 RepID=A0A915PSI0_9BILA
MYGCRGVLLVVLSVVSLSFLYNEYLTYFVNIYVTCSWPVSPSGQEETRVILLTDIHLLGPRRGHWFDKLRREWQMYRSFQSAISLMHPHAVFFLGDLFDESTISTQQDLVNYINRFNELFYVPEDVQRHCILGNHDIGFHDEINPARLQFLSQHFSRSFADHIVVGGNHFVLLNSMTVERDGCPFCTATEYQIEDLSRTFNCTGDVKACNMNSRPILLLHIPLYRKSDARCPEDYDAAPESMKSQVFHVGVDCLSNASSHYILEKLKPRAVFDGHAHYSCKTWWPPYSMYEWTLSSFSWRNIPQPAFLLATITPHDIQVNKCFLPNEKTVIGSYVATVLGLVIFLAYCLVSHLRYRQSYSSYQVVAEKCD